jgi:dipeptide/tripeptide permease
VFSIVITGIAAEYVGKKMCLIVLSIPAVLFWTLTYISTNVFHLYAARTVAGKVNFMLTY